MEDEPRRYKEDLEDYHERKFPWFFFFGIKNKIGNEINLYRNLKPYKINIL